MEQHYLIICNPGSGKGNGLKALTLFEQFLRQKGISFESFQLSYPHQLNRFSTLVVIGGDGTLNHVLNHYREIHIPIALIGGGTGNDYVKLHSGKGNWPQQFETAIQNHYTRVDAGICNDKIFINGVGIGFDGWVVKKNLGKRFFSGIAAYYSTIISLLLFYREGEIQIQTPEKQLRQNTFMLSVAKGNTYGGGFTVAPLANPTDGLFDLVVIGKINLFNRFRYLPVIEKGKHLHLPFVKHQKAQTVHVKSNYPLQAHLDGEWMESHEFIITIQASKYKIKSAVF